MILQSGIIFNWNMDSLIQASIANFKIPEKDRRRGEGTRLYNEWEAALPETVEIVELWTPDYEGLAFWKSVGYTPKNPDIEIDEEFGVVLIKRLR
jgi:hypothetical protein